MSGRPSTLLACLFHSQEQSMRTKALGFFPPTPVSLLQDRGPASHPPFGKQSSFAKRCRSTSSLCASVEGNKLSTVVALLSRTPRKQRLSWSPECSGNSRDQAGALRTLMQLRRGPVVEELGTHVQSERDRGDRARQRLATASCSVTAAWDSPMGYGSWTDPSQ